MKFIKLNKYTILQIDPDDFGVGKINGTYYRTHRSSSSVALLFQKDIIYPHVLSLECTKQLDGLLQ